MNNLVCLVIIVVAATTTTSFSKGIPHRLTEYEGETYWLVKSTDALPVQMTTRNIIDLIDPETEKFVFLSHGWHGDRLTEWYQLVTTSLLSRFPTWNVIQVDWKTAASDDYPIVVNNTIHVGENVGNTINDIISKCQSVNGDKIILVGHSLGAHVMGFAGKTVKSANNSVSRIVGLDPALSVWDELPCEERLCKNDAKFLSVIHTDAGSCGFVTPIGHSDFYPNNGTNQPGCNLGPLISHGCNHMRSTYFFNEGVMYPNHFTSTSCSDYYTYITSPWLCGEQTAQMGDLFSEEKGVFYLKTNASPPFSIN